MCPSCGHRVWSVDRSVHADAPPLRKSISEKELERVERVAGFYTQDYVLRRRTCERCGKREHFIELSLEDFEAIVAERVREATEEKL